MGERLLEIKYELASENIEDISRIIEELEKMNQADSNVCELLKSAKLRYEELIKKKENNEKRSNRLTKRIIISVVLVAIILILNELVIQPFIVNQSLEELLSAQEYEEALDILKSNSMPHNSFYKLGIYILDNEMDGYALSADDYYEIASQAFMRSDSYSDAETYYEYVKLLEDLDKSDYVAIKEILDTTAKLDRDDANLVRQKAINCLNSIAGNYYSDGYGTYKKIRLCEDGTAYTTIVEDEFDNYIIVRDGYEQLEFVGINFSTDYDEGLEKMSFEPPNRIIDNKHDWVYIKR